MTRHRFEAPRPPAAIAVAVQEPHQSAHQAASSVLELARLARGLGIEVVRTVQQARAHQSLASLVSEGRLRELAALTGGPGPSRPGPAVAPVPHDALVDLVLVDGTLSAGQQRALELALGVEVLDRSALILRVFAQRARTREARLQVELAEELYRAPRIRDDHGLGDREGGGGRGARGHSNVELAKQKSRDRAAALRRQLAELPKREAVRRRRRSELPQVALVGYTNAGKSSLMRALTGSSVHVEDALFATLDPTVRALAPATTPRVLVSDTVGFLANLPHELVASFRATLEQARHADLLLVVADASDPELDQQLRVTRETLVHIGAGALPQRLVLNKVDRIDVARRELLAACYPEATLLSAHAKADVQALRETLVQHFASSLVEGNLLVPYAQGAMLGEIHQRAQVLSHRHTARGTRMRLRAPRSSWARWRSELPSAFRS